MVSIHLHVSIGYYGVTAGPHLPLVQAHELRARALKEGAQSDTYLTPGTKFGKQIYP